MIRRTHACTTLLVAAAAALLLPGSGGAATGTAAPAKLQQLVVNIGSFPTTLDPSLATTDADVAAAGALFAPLYRSAGGATDRIEPFLAAGAPKVEAGGMRYTVTLRAARWSDGTPILAADVVTAFERGRHVGRGHGEFDAVASVTALGPRTVRFTLARPVPWFDELLASGIVTPIPTRVVRAQGAKWATTTKLVSSGPFRLAGVRGRTELALVRNERWWGYRSVYLRSLLLRAIPEAAATPLFAANRLDASIADTSIRPELLPTWRLDRRFRTVREGVVQYLFANTDNPELASPAVRRGLALAVDRTALSKLVSDGVDRPLTTIVPDGVRGGHTVAPDGGSLVSASGSANLAAAREQLAAGGWVSGRRLDLYYSLAGRFDARIAGALRTQLALVGVDVLLHPMAAVDFAKVGYAVSPTLTDVDLLLDTRRLTFSDPAALHRAFGCAGVEGGLDPSNYCTTEGDALLGAATVFAPFGARVQAHRDLEAQLTGPDGDMPAIPLLEGVGTLLQQRWVHGYTQHPSGRVDFERAWVDSTRPDFVGHAKS
ncbi:MAG: Oligopeptide transporter, periplasmic oligopeptide-binding protein OppA [Thermoleophilia bacterium]|nr:Oligopeptide transporter, periplasmic oligopeptide-binding protein OppA [Thermoleophilia bacterium]